MHYRPWRRDRKWREARVAGGELSPHPPRRDPVLESGATMDASVWVGCKANGATMKR